MAKIIMDVDVDLIARVFSKTLRALPIEGYGIRKMEGCGKWKSVMQ